MSAAAKRAEAIEEAANPCRACDVRFASTGAVCASTAATVTGAASGTERGATTSLVVGRCGGAGVARASVFKRPIFVDRQRKQVRRRDLNYFAFSTDPFARLKRPVSDIIGPT